MRLPTLFLAAVTFVFSYLVLVIGSVVPRFLQVTFKLKPGEVATFMSYPTRLATDYSWVFVVVLLLVLLAAMLLFRGHPGHEAQVTVVALCVQAGVVWIALFCYCYDGFCGPMSLHRSPQFDAIEFFRFGTGVFPATLAAVLIPLSWALLRIGSTSPTRTKSVQRTETNDSAAATDQASTAAGSRR